jgi:hypothetical protein
VDTAQTTRVEIEYLMTLHVPSSGPPQQVDNALMVFRAGADGSAKGPKINGTIVAPTADWLRVMPSGSLRVDARMMVRTDDGAVIHVSYGGVINVSAENFQRMGQGGTLTADDMYFIIAPVFQTSHAKYAWLNRIQAIGKVVAVQGGERGFVTYDIFSAS